MAKHEQMMVVKLLVGVMLSTLLH